jgi:hypothetical protein
VGKKRERESERARETKGKRIESAKMNGIKPQTESDQSEGAN